MSNNKDMKAIILARVSTEEQKKDGHSIPAQLSKAREYVDKLKLPIFDEHKFDESSLKDKRVKFEKVMTQIKKSDDPIALIVETVDRLQRSFKESVMLDKYRKQGKVELHFIRENLVISRDSNSSDIGRWDMAVMFAKMYVGQISDNVKRSIVQKLAKGEHCGKAPIGYDNITKPDDSKDVVLKQPEANMIVDMYTWYETGVCSMGQLRAKVKDVYGITLAKGKIDAILKNPFYFGEMLFKGKRYPHRYKPLISKELFDRVQSKKEENRKRPCKPIGLPFLYRGLLRCGQEGCGCSFTPERKRKKSGKEFIYYHCTEYFGKHGTAWLTEKKITEQFMEILEDISVSDALAEKITTTLKASHEGKKDYHREVFNGLTREYKRIESRLEKMYEHLLDERISNEEYDAKREKYREAQMEIRAKLDNLEKTDEEYYLSVKYIIALAQRAPELYQSSEPEKKRAIWKAVLQNCVVNDVSLVPTYRKPFDALVNCKDRQIWGG